MIKIYICLALSTILISNTAIANSPSFNARPLHLFGAYFNTQHQIMLPLSYQSDDFGQTWQVTESFPITTIHSHTLLAGFCNQAGARCVSAGLIFNNRASQYDTISFYKSPGSAFWQRAAMADRIPYRTSLTDVKCDSDVKHCIALGYANNDKYFPLSYISDNAGANWHFGGNLSTTTSTLLTKLVCDAQAKYCIALGALQNGSRASVVYYTTNGGIEWLVAPNPPILSSALDALTDIACDKDAKNCLAIGRAEKELDVDIGIQPINYASIDGGKTWTALRKMTSLPQTTRTTLNRIICDATATRCIAAGEFSDPTRGGYTSPVVYRSENGGVDWQFANKLPAAWTRNENIEITALACDDKMLQCSIAGDSFNPATLQRLPISYYSNDSGAHWQKSVKQPPVVAASNYTEIKDIN